MCWLSRRNHLYIPRYVVIQLNAFIAVPNHFVFWKSKFSFYKFKLEGGNAVIFHARHENDLKTKQTESEGM